MKIFGLSGFFNPDLREYRIKSALFTSRNPDFPPLNMRWLVSRKDSAAFRRNTSVLTITNLRLELWKHGPQHSTHRRDYYYVTQRHSVSRWT